MPMSCLFWFHSTTSCLHLLSSVRTPKKGLGPFWADRLHPAAYGPSNSGWVPASAGLLECEGMELLITGTALCRLQPVNLFYCFMGVFIDPRGSCRDRRWGMSLLLPILNSTPRGHHQLAGSIRAITGDRHFHLVNIPEKRRRCHLP